MFLQSPGVLWPTQLFFSLTDLLPAYLGYYLLASGPPPPQSIIQSALSVSCAHIVLALWDQGAVNILTGSSLAYRDMGLFASDGAGVLFAAPFTNFKCNGGIKLIGLKIFLLLVFYQLLKAYTGSR